MRTTTATERIQILHNEAQKTVKTYPQLARHYIKLLQRIAQRTRTPIPSQIKQGICKHCDTPLIPGYNSTIRINQRREPHITTKCHTCGNITRRPIRRKNHDHSHKYRS